MITLRKANKIVRITDNELDKYLAKGFSPYEPKTTKVQESKPAPIVDKVEESVISNPAVEVTKPKATKRRKQS